MWTMTMMRWAEVAAETKHAEAAATLYDQLAPFAWLLPNSAVSIGAPISYALGRLAHVLGHDDDADRRFAYALDRAETFQAPPYVALIQLAWARALLEREAGDTDRARELLERGAAVGHELGIPRFERLAADLLASAPR
jgi:hypothetical protein